MKKEIVYTYKYALILSDDIMVDNDYYAYHICEQLCINNDHYLFPKGAKKIIAHLPLSDAPILEGVPLLPPLRQVDDVEALAEQEFPTFGSDLTLTVANNVICQAPFVKGYNKAKEKYKYTEEDLFKMFEFGMELTPYGVKEFLKDKMTVFNKYIQSLQQPSRPTHFKCETTPMDLDEIREKGSGFLNANIYKIKTITNSQGQVELVGKYI